MASAIALESVVSNTASNVTSHSSPTITPAGSDRALVVCIGTTQRNVTDAGPSSVQFNSEGEFTQIGTDTYSGGSDDLRIWVGYFLAPSTTASTVDVTWADANSTWRGLGMTVYALSGVSDTQDRAYDAASTQAAGASISNTTTSLDRTTGDYIIDCLVCDDNTTISENAGGTERSNVTAGNFHAHGSSSYELGITGGNTTMSWTFSPNAGGLLNQVAIIPGTQATASTILPQMMNAGLYTGGPG